MSSHHVKVLWRPGCTKNATVILTSCLSHTPEFPQGLILAGLPSCGPILQLQVQDNTGDPRDVPRQLLQLLQPDDPSEEPQGPAVLNMVAQHLVVAFAAKAGAPGVFSKPPQDQAPAEKRVEKALEQVMKEAVLFKLQLLATDPCMKLVVPGARLSQLVSRRRG